MQFKASAPGSLMLLGEFAVLAGKQALVCALDKRISVTLTPREGTQINIFSQELGEFHTKLAHLSIETPYQYVLAVLKHYHARLRTGCDIEITTNFSHQVGFGSSAAITVAMLAVVTNWLGMRFSALDLVREGKLIIKAVQGVGSGADIAASVYGGIVSFQAQPLFAEKLETVLPISVIYTGYKTPTPEVIKRVQTQFAAFPALLNSLYNAIGQCAIEGVQAIRQGNAATLGMMMDKQQGLMDALGVSTPLLRYLIEELRSETSILGAKISGSGLGDCVIGLGCSAKKAATTDQQQGVAYLTVEMSKQGVYSEKS